MGHTMQVVELEAIRQGRVVTEPYTFMMSEGLLKEGRVAALRRDFPDIKKPGYLTVDEVELHGDFKTLIEELESDAFAAAVADKLKFDLVPYPRLTTIMKYSTPKHGRIHTDSAAKLATLLVYMNDQWDDGGKGRLRALYNDEDYVPYAAEVAPVMGHVFAFVRSEDSWHGHEPFEGERRVVQVTWVTSQEEVEHKKKRNKLTQLWKKLVG